MSEWQKVFEDSTSHRVEIVKSVLEDMGITSVIVNKKDSSYQFGHFEIKVAPDDVLRAIKVIKEDIKF